MQMKINFDELFGLSSSESKSNFKNESIFSQASTNLGSDELPKAPSQKSAIIEQKEEASEYESSKELKVSQTMRVLSNKQIGENYYSFLKSSFSRPSAKQKQMNSKTEKKELNKAET
jgi:hypothetical protein